MIVTVAVPTLFLVTAVLVLIAAILWAVRRIRHRAAKRRQAKALEKAVKVAITPSFLTRLKGGW